MKHEPARNFLGRPVTHNFKLIKPERKPMRSKTQICAGLRNIGDADDDGQYFNGTLQESLVWLIESLGKISVAKRVVFVIARNRSEVEAGLALRRGNSAKVSDDLMSQLRGMIGELDPLVDDTDSDLPIIGDDDWSEK